MKTVILAGGLGSRISEESHLKPKPLIEIGGKQVPNLIDDSNEDKYCVGQMAMFPVLVKAVQDLKKIVDAQAKEIAELKSNQPLEKVEPKL